MTQDGWAVSHTTVDGVTKSHQTPRHDAYVVLCHRLACVSAGCANRIDTTQKSQKKLVGFISKKY
jgi:hypothetical protein